MDASSLPPEFVRELAALRRRAYGLDADIEADPIALQRLSELEAAMHPPAPPAGSVDAGAAAAASESRPDEASAPRPRTLTVADVPDELFDPMRQPPTVRRRVPRRGVVAVTAVLLTVGWLVSISAPSRGDVVLAATSSSQQQRQDLIDQIDLADVGMIGPRFQSFSAFRELEVWTAAADTGTTCLIVGSPVDGFEMACTPRPLQPALDLRVGDHVTAGQVGDLAAGSVIRLVLHGGDVGVWIAEAVDADR